mgnify:CR=1 FL=1
MNFGFLRQRRGWCVIAMALLGPIAPYYALMRRKLPVTDAEWAQLRTNEAPYLRRIR